MAQQIATQTSLTFHDAESALNALASLDVVRFGDQSAMAIAFAAATAARPDMDHVYWIDQFGALQVSVPAAASALGSEFEPPDIVRRALQTNSPVFDVGLVHHGTFTAGVVIAQTVRDPAGQVLGILAISLALDDLSKPLVSVVHYQARQHRHLRINVIDSRAEIIASDDPSLLLDTVVNTLPGPQQALRGIPTTAIGEGLDGQELFSATPVLGPGWAVIAERPTYDALAVITWLHLKLMGAVFFFALGGLEFWLMLLNRVIYPLHALAVLHLTIPRPKRPVPPASTALAGREDEVGGLARSLVRLERDVLAQLGQLRTLLDTSNAVTRSLDPRLVVGTIIQQVRRLVDVQAAAVFVPDEHGVLRVLVSDGHGDAYDHAVAIPPDDSTYPAALALRRRHARPARRR